MSEQHDELENVRLTAEEVIRERFRLSKSLQDEVADLILQRESLEGDVAKTINLLATEDANVMNAQQLASILRSEIDGLHITINNLNEDQIAAELRVSGLTIEEKRLKTSILTLQEAFKGWQLRTDNVEIEYTAKTADREKTLRLLDAKLLRITQQLEERQRSEESTRDELAKMRQELNQRDQNLRIREAKVEQGENKMIQNANLMNL